MDPKKLIAGYLRYNHWANASLVRWLRDINKDLLYKETPSSFSSIDLTLQHINHAQLFWLAVINEQDVSDAQEKEVFLTNMADTVMEDLLISSQRMIDTFTMFSETELEKKLTTESIEQSRYEFIIHVVNHNTHHRGQVITMARCIGIVDNIPPLDYDVYLWWKSNS